MKKQITTMEMYEKDIEDLEAAVLDGEELLENIDPKVLTSDDTEIIKGADFASDALGIYRRRYNETSNSVEKQMAELEANLAVAKNILVNGYQNLERDYQSSKKINIPVNGILVSGMKIEEYYHKFLSKRIHNLCKSINNLIYALTPKQKTPQKVYVKR